MPGQEDRALARIKQTAAMIRDSKRIKVETLESWAILNFGVRPRTIAMYVTAMIKMGTVLWDPKTKEYVWNEAEG